MREPLFATARAAKRGSVYQDYVVRRGKVDPADELALCSEDGCHVPDRKDRNPVPKEKIEIGGIWITIALKDLDDKLNGGEIILLGASWCAACKVAKEKLPKKYSKASLFYVDFDVEDETALRAKFALGDAEITLPILMGCSSRGQYERMKLPE